ncbi:HTH-type transcriptional repressor ComR [Flavobacteriaceae bacterium UJ101]|nr:HTH-type transcriptional repressor ComR [Flavobacteriaceae bacterium UJ101]
MPRRKAYIESEVIDKAMHVFWANGYQATSTRMLEKSMGINQFSIYSSFKNKEGVLSKCITHYQNEVAVKLMKKAESESEKGIATIQYYFKSFIQVSNTNQKSKGCFVNNVMNELSEINSTMINSKVEQFITVLQSFLTKQLQAENKWNDAEIEKRVMYLSIAFNGLVNSSKILDLEIIEEQIEFVIEKL